MIPSESSETAPTGRSASTGPHQAEGALYPHEQLIKAGMFPWIMIGLTILTAVLISILYGFPVIVSFVSVCLIFWGTVFGLKAVGFIS